MQSTQQIQHSQLQSTISLSSTMTMQAALYNATPHQIIISPHPLPTLQDPTDALVRITTSAICGSDLHVYHGLQGGPEPPWVMGHEAMGYIAEIGEGISALSVGDYVVIPDRVASGHLDMYPPGDHSFGAGEELSGLQAEYARVPFADISLIPIPYNKTTPSTQETAHDRTLDSDYLTISDIFPTAWAALTFSGFEPGDSVAVFGAGPVGLLAAYSAFLRGASKVYVVDRVPMRLQRAEEIGAIPVSFNETHDPVKEILRRESHGVTRAVDCVGMEAVNAKGEMQQGIVVQNMVSVLGVNGGIGLVGVYMAQDSSLGAPLGDNITKEIAFPVTEFFNKGLSIQGGVVDPKILAPELVELIASGRARPGFIATAEIGIEDVPEYYARFDRHDEIKVYIRFPDSDGDPR